MLLKAEQKKGREMGIMRSLKTFSIFPVIISSSLLPFCHGADSISPGQSISGNQNIISAGNNFVLGFFSAGNSQNHYIGIWFNKVSVQTVVWVANRETPITNSSSGVLKIGNDGNLILLNGNGTTVWSTNAGFESSEANTTVAELLDSGNLILKRTASSSTETPLWQSFDYPTDTFLPGMKLGLNKNTGKTWSLTSWKNRNDPSPGTYVLAMDPNRTSQFFIMQSGAPHWRSGFWNGQNFAGAPEIKRNYVYNFTYISNDDGDRYFTYFLVDTSVISMLLMNLSGQAEQKTWDEKSEQWSSLWVQPKSQCDDYGVCGAFGTCDENALPVCDCLQGFDPQSPQDWISNNWSDGCRRRIPLKCGNQDKFLRQTRMKFPDGSRSLVVSNGQECEAECRKNCACTAYALATATECLVWLGPLTDLQVFTVDTVELYIRLEASEVVSTSAKNRSKARRAVIIVATTILAIILLAICIVLWWRQREKERGMTDTSQELALFELDGNANTPNKHGKRSGPELPVFSFGSITLATDNFSVTNKLGEGGFGPVYKGKLPEGQEIAVKRLSRNSGQGLEEFKNEVVLISKLQHRNLLKVLGCCIQGEEKILIYEYMPNKSLDFFLFDPTKRETLDWEKRFHIIEGIAQGLLYLHQYSRLRIIHRDLKASNILLDGEMNPKISDFGMARIFGGDQTQANTRRVVGTYGYMSPEYALDGRFSIKSDVFSFGVLLLEIISGKKNSGFYHFEQSLNLIGHAWLLWRDGRGIELIDSLLSNSCPTSSVLKCIHVGLLCVQEDAGDRPTMSSVVVMLDSQTTSLPPPKQPGFSIGRIPTEPSSSSTGQRIGSVNEITISMAEGR